MVSVAKGKRPDRKDTANQAMRVDAIPAKIASLNFSVFSQGSVKPRTETTLVAEVAGQIVSVSSNFIAGGFFREGEVLLQIDPSDYRNRPAARPGQPRRAQGAVGRPASPLRPGPEGLDQPGPRG